MGRSTHIGRMAYPFGSGATKYGDRCGVTV
jgi:hypothetical protein